MSWHRGPLYGFDLETSGVDVTNDRIVTAAIIDIQPGQPTRTRTWLVDCGVEIPAEATAVHGITTEKSHTEGEPPAKALDEIATELGLAIAAGTPIVGFNVAFDLSMLDHELVRHEVGGFEERLGSYEALAPVLDPHVLDKRFDKYRKGSRTLTATCEAYGLVLDNAHDADADAIAACRLLFKIAAIHDLPGRYGLHQIHDEQVIWRAAQMESLAAYFRKQKKDVSDISTEWPVRRIRSERAA